MNPANVNHQHAKLLEGISRFLDENYIITDLVYHGLTKDRISKKSGAKGMSAEQVLHAAVVKMVGEFSYEALAFHLMVSICYRNFCRVPYCYKGFKKAAVCKNIKAISAEIWEAINKVVMAYAYDKGIEKGRVSRFDCAVVSSDIHPPSKSSLLYDAVRVISRLVKRAREGLSGMEVPFTDHTRRAKRRMLGIQNAKGKPQRTKGYRDLLKAAGKSVGYGERVLEEIRAKVFPDPEEALMAMALAEELDRFIDLSRQVIDQTERRVLRGEKVPPSEKVVSLFEPHTDIIIKDRRGTFYGHKVCLSSGHSNLITDCLITEGNPADSTLTIDMLDRHESVFDHHPLKVALDGGFASKANLEAAKTRGIKDVCFAKRCGLHVEAMCRSEYVSNRLRRFRAGIESGISWLKRCFAALALPSASGRASGPSRAMSGRLLFPLTLLL